jgi:SAM-dependent methyltransferase
MMKLLWNILYLSGRSPWDTNITPSELMEVIEGNQIPPGRAIDVGCGTGTNAIYLAQHGFQVTGVDIARLAILQARYKAKRADIPVKFYAGDALKLGTPKWPVVRVPINFILDIGCLHSLAEIHLQSYIDMLLRILSAGGYYMLYSWGPRQWRGHDAGVTPEELRTALGNYFNNIWTRQGEEHGALSYWYFFQRLS